MATEVERLQRAARAANSAGRYRELGAILARLDRLMPFGGRYDAFMHFCTELETEALRCEGCGT